MNTLLLLTFKVEFSVAPTIPPTLLSALLIVASVIWTFSISEFIAVLASAPTLSPETEILLPSIINPLIFALLITLNIGTLFPIILLLLPSSLPLNSTSIIEPSEEK